MVHVYENDGKSSTAKNDCPPASLLSVEIKIFEKFSNNRFLNHIKKCGLFPKFQYGFKSSQSITALLPDVSNRPCRGFTRFTANSNLMEFFCKNFWKNIQLILELLKVPFLGLIFLYYTLMNFLMMLSVLLFSTYNDSKCDQV